MTGLKYPNEHSKGDPLWLPCSCCLKSLYTMIGDGVGVNATRAAPTAKLCSYHNMSSYEKQALLLGYGVLGFGISAGTTNAPDLI
jgi:hypothetical protein